MYDPRLQHLMAKAKMGDGLRLAGLEQPPAQDLRLGVSLVGELRVGLDCSTCQHELKLVTAQAEPGYSTHRQMPR